MNNPDSSPTGCAWNSFPRLQISQGVYDPIRQLYSYSCGIQFISSAHEFPNATGAWCAFYCDPVNVDTDRPSGACICFPCRIIRNAQDVTASRDVHMGEDLKEDPESPVGEAETVELVSVRLNPEVVPARFPRYRHPSHRHRLFMLTGRERSCDNISCRRNIELEETIFSCIRCGFDLCQRCFQLDSEVHVPLSAGDARICDSTITPVELGVVVHPDMARPETPVDREENVVVGQYNDMEHPVQYSL